MATCDCKRTQKRIINKVGPPCTRLEGDDDKCNLNASSSHIQLIRFFEPKCFCCSVASFCRLCCCCCCCYNYYYYYHYIRKCMYAVFILVYMPSVSPHIVTHSICLTSLPMYLFIRTRHIVVTKTTELSIWTKMNEFIRCVYCPKRTVHFRIHLQFGWYVIFSCFQRNFREFPDFLRDNLPFSRTNFENLSFSRWTVPQYLWKSPIRWKFENESFPPRLRMAYMTTHTYESNV